MATTRPTTPGRVTPLAEKKTAGRPRKEPPKDAAEQIRKACEGGASRVGVAVALGVNQDVLTRWFDEQPDLKEAFEQGRERERKVLHDALTTAAKGGNITAAIFLLKARHGYREGEEQNQANRVAITFNLPGAMPLDKFVIENGTTPVQQLPVSSSRATGRA